MKRCLFLALTSVAAPAAAQTSDELRAIIAKQQAQIDALTARLTALEAKAETPAMASPPPVAATAPAAPKPASPPPVAVAFKGSPEFTTSDGWRFKLRGRVNLDLGYVSKPENILVSPDLGLRTRFRRIRLGVEGDTPGGFAYKAEVDFADGVARAADVMLTYRASKTAPFEIGLGHTEPFNGFEQISSSRYTSTIERGEYNEAFANVRRVGAFATYISPDNELRVSAGVFGDAFGADRSSDRFTLAGRAFWAPKIGETQLHLGANASYRTYPGSQLGFAYRARPFVATTDARFVNTGNLALTSDRILGYEFIAIRGPFHFITEGQWLTANTIRPGQLLEPNETALGRRTSFDPTFFGMVAEAGYFFTGETRAYQNGLWARTRPLRPLGKGGIGAVSLNLRYDHLDLSDRRGGAGPENTVDGGEQEGYLAALVWQPNDYVRFTFQYAHGEVTAGPLQLIVNPNGILPVEKRSFGFDTAAIRAAWDF
ncbi:porin [Sphingomonas sp.]|jgi:phosphate-selective porin OprO/OprP|uniref:porin n=1 Tax=Sphingomonas sp. TaxID=28214 RepID=UPI002DF2F559|nr:porin [Sphingomonas sp.]